MDFDLYPAFLENLEAMAVSRQERILIAVSGGPDSMALLHLLWRFNARKIGVFHLNHGFRENASRDAQFVQEYAEKLNIPAQIETYDIMGFLSSSGESKQQGARKIRYQLLRNFAEANGYHCIALGHHGDDQAETVLMRILRGTGLHGLAGIPPRRGPFVRPLLNVYKEDIMQYCHDFEVPYVMDESNFEPIYLRNKIRQELLPLLAEQYNPEIMAQLVQLADLAREDELELKARAEQIARQHLQWRQGQVLFPRRVFAELSVAMQRRVLRLLLQAYKGNLLQISYSHIETWRLMLLENSSFRLSLPRVWVSANAKHIFVGDFLTREWAPAELQAPGKVRAGYFTITAEVMSKEDLTPRGADCEDFDLDKLALPVQVRPRKAGDRMLPFGGAGSKKVKDLFIDVQIPVEQRDSWPLICDRKDILWIPKVRRSAKAAVTESTVRVLRLGLE